MDKHCVARQYSDQMYCSLCDLTWDMNDPDPPKCEVPDEIKQAAKNGWIRIDLVANHSQ